LTPFGCGLPFGVVNGYYSSITAVHFALNYALFFGFDFNQFGSHGVVASAISDQKVWHIHSLLAS
jgi:hypothetical protein